MFEGWWHPVVGLRAFYKLVYIISFIAALLHVTMSPALQHLDVCRAAWMLPSVLCVVMLFQGQVGLTFYGASYSDIPIFYWVELLEMLRWRCFSQLLSLVLKLEVYPIFNSWTTFLSYNHISSALLLLAEAPLVTFLLRPRTHLVDKTYRHSLAFHYWALAACVWHMSSCTDVP